MKIGQLNIADSFMGFINPLNRETKLDLISKIADSLKRSEKNEKDDSWKKLFGAFESDKTADEIIEEIRNSRYTNREIENL